MKHFGAYVLSSGKKSVKNPEILVATRASTSDGPLYGLTLTLPENPPRSITVSYSSARKAIVTEHALVDIERIASYRPLFNKDMRNLPSGIASVIKEDLFPSLERYINEIRAHEIPIRQTVCAAV